jgi:hypothetical protein
VSYTRHIPYGRHVEEPHDGRAPRWSLHDPGKVLRDVARTLVDGGDALRHMKVI